MNCPNGFIIFVAMKRVILLLICVLSAMSCNPNVFIEPLEVELSRTEFDIPFSGGSIEINASHGDWEIQNVTIDHIDAWWVSEEQMKYVSNFMSFEITRPTPSRLVLTLDESVKSNPSLIQIFIGNDYESEIISINISACCDYSFDRVEYGTPLVLSDDNSYELIWSQTMTNNSAQPMDWECPIFDERFCHTIWFPASTIMSGDMPYVMWYDTLMEFVGKPFRVPVPEAYLLEGGLTFSGETVEFSYDKITQPLAFNTCNTTVTLSPGKNTIMMYWGYVEYEVPYTMWFRHSGEGRDLYFEGKFTSKVYNGDWKVEL